MPNVPAVKLKNAPIGECWALKLMLPEKAGTESVTIYLEKAQNNGQRVIVYVAQTNKNLFKPSLFHGPAGQAADEFPLKGQEQHRRRQDCQQRARQEHTVLLHIDAH